MKATPEQRSQIKEFFLLLHKYHDDILLHPLIDERTGTERLAICIADRSEGIIYVKGLWFLPNDPLCGRFAFKDDDNVVLSEKPPNFVRRLVKWWKVCRL